MSGHAAKNATGHSATLDPIMDEVYIRKSGYGSWTVV